MFDFITSSKTCQDANSFSIQSTTMVGMESAMTDTLCTLDYIGISGKLF